MNLFSKISKQNNAFYLYENQGWEKALVTSWKKYNHGNLVGSINSTIRFWDLRYFQSKKLSDSLKKILISPNNSEKSWVWEQYDQTVMGDTIQKSGGDAAVVRIHGKQKAVALTVDSSANYCLSNPFTGGKQVVCESWRNLISVGATPIAITNCLNFGNPEKDKIMGQFVEVIDGIKQACEYLDFPVVSGNVSFYNETKSRAIAPTPTIGGVGLIVNINNMITLNFKDVENYIFAIGKTSGHLHQSEFFKLVVEDNTGPPPEINLFNEKSNGLAMKELINKKLVKSVHDISSGGIIVSLVEMCIAGNVGAKIKIPHNKISQQEYLFGEDQSRYLIEVDNKNKEKVSKLLEKNNTYYEIIGRTQKESFELHKEFSIKLSSLNKFNSFWFNNFFKDNK